jgi:hypothetical protein
MDGTPYYIGKGKNNRAANKHKIISVPEDKSKIVFLETNLTEIGAFAIERRMIRWYGRKDLGTGILRNRSDGGEGATGRRHTAESRAKISKSMKGRPGKSPSPEIRQKISNATKGRISEKKGTTLSAETKEKISIANKGKCGWHHTSEAKEKMSLEHAGENNHMFGKQHSEETKAKMRLAHAKLKHPQPQW